YEFENMRASKFDQARQKFKTNSRFYFGKINVTAIAIGKDKVSVAAATRRDRSRKGPPTKKK
ncbi:hypothetical protein PENTCL1PPCAC_22433, partial [Pristionchus entomophagus]